MNNIRILIIGNGGTGKSTLANRLGNDLGIPVTHLDLLSWKDNYERVPETDFRQALNESLKHERMIIEGWAYQSTMYERLIWADVIIYLKCPLDRCLQTVFNRNKEFNNKTYAFDPFTGDREAHNDLYKSAVEKVHYEYEPIVQAWLLDASISNKKIYELTSIGELNERYMNMLGELKQRQEKIGLNDDI